MSTRPDPPLTPPERREQRSAETCEALTTWTEEACGAEATSPVSARHQHIPDVVLDRIERYVKDPVNYCLTKHIPALGNKTPYDWVNDGDGTWEEVLGMLERIFSFEVTQ